MEGNTNRERLEAAIPDMPPAFDYAVRQTLEGIVRIKSRRRRLRVLALSFCCVMLAAGAALALTGRIGLFNFFGFGADYEAVQPEAYDLTRYDVAFYSFPHVDVAIREAAWDGRVLRILYSVRDRAAASPYTDAQLNQYIANEDGDYITGFTMPNADADGVRAYYGCDYLFINGESLSLTGMMGSRAGEQNGEVLVALECELNERIQSEGAPITLGERFTVSLPIVTFIDENGRRVNNTPEELSFEVENTNLPGVSRVRLPKPARFAGGALEITDFTITPIRVYVTARYVFNQDATAQAVAAMDNAVILADLADKGGEALRSLDFGYGLRDVETTFDVNAAGEWQAAYRLIPGKTPYLEVSAAYVTCAHYPDTFTYTLCEGIQIDIPNRRAE